MSLSEEEITKAIRDRVLEILRANGVVAYTPDEVTTPELEDAIQGGE